MSKPSRVNRLLASLQEEMLNAGGRLPSLNYRQNRAEIRNNSIEAVTPTKTDLPNHQEGTTTMMTAVKNEASNENLNPPPAGGQQEHSQGQEIVSFLQKSGLVLAPKRTWKDKTLDFAVPVGTTVAAVLVAQGILALVNRQVSKRKEAKQLAASSSTPQLKVG